MFRIPVFDKYLTFNNIERRVALLKRPAPTDFLEQKVQESLSAKSLGNNVDSDSITPLLLGIIPTRKCNLSCAYCGFEGADPHEKFDMKNAIALIDWYAELDDTKQKRLLNIHFFGGEPSFAAFEVMALVHYTRQLAAIKKFDTWFEISTNGVMSEKMAGFVADYFHSIVLSFDGFSVFHNKYRTNSYSEVAKTAKIFGKSKASLCLRICVTNESVGSLSSAVAELCQLFNPDSISVEPLQKTSKTCTQGIFPPDPFEFARQFFYAEKIAEKFGVKLVFSANISDSSKRSFCPLGYDALIFNPDNRISACYLFEKEWQEKGLDLNLGYVKDNEVVIDLEKVKEIRKLTLNKPRCTTCFCNTSCAGGCHVNNTYPSSSNEYSDFCVGTRLISACTLLNEIGQSELAEKLLNDTNALKTLAFQKSDLVL